MKFYEVHGCFSCEAIYILPFESTTKILNGLGSVIYYPDISMLSEMR